jgi:hypothetical protein
MTESDRLALVAIAVACGVSASRAWELVDSLPTDLRAASLEVEARALEAAYPAGVPA